MIVLDTYAVLALLRDEPAADQVRQILRDGNEAALTVLGVAEAIDYLVRIAGVEEREAVLDIAQLDLYAPAPLEVDVAVRAGILRARQYHRRERAVSLTDCVALESARALDAPLATADPHLLDVCMEEGVPVIPLPDTHGAVWTP